MIVTLVAVEATIKNYIWQYVALLTIPDIMRQLAALNNLRFTRIINRKHRGTHICLFPKTDNCRKLVHFCSPRATYSKLRRTRFLVYCTEIFNVYIR